MPRNTLAIVCVEPNRVELQQVPLPEPGPDDVVFVTHHSMISNGTERSSLAGERPSAPGASPFPYVGGYQKVGIVESFGKNVEGLSEGDWVFGTMGFVEMPKRNWCGHVRVNVMDKNEVLKLPEGLDPVAASGLVITQVGYNHGSRPPITAGTRAIVVGDGQVGLWSAETLQERGAAVLLIGRHDYRLKTFTPRGDSRAINSQQVDVEAAAAEFAPGGAPVVIDTLTTAEALHASMRFLAHDGHVVAGGFYILGHHLISYFELVNREATLYTPGGWTRRRLEKTLEWIAQGKLQALNKITHRWPISRAVEAYELLVSKSEPFLAMVIDWEESA